MARQRKPRKRVLKPPALLPTQDRTLVKREIRHGMEVAAYDPEMAAEMVQLLSEGHTLREIGARGTGYVSPATFRRWASEHLDLMKAFKLALEVSAYALDEEALARSRQLAENPISKDHISSLRVLNEQLRWSAARRNPSTFGDKTQVSVQVPIQINTSLDLGQGGLTAAKGATDPYAITATVVDPETGQRNEGSETRSGITRQPLTWPAPVTTFLPPPNDKDPDNASQSTVPRREQVPIRQPEADEGQEPDESERPG